MQFINHIQSSLMYAKLLVMLLLTWYNSAGVPYDSSSANYMQNKDELNKTGIKTKT